jgi:hypothetical protein
LTKANPLTVKKEGPGSPESISERVEPIEDSNVCRSILAKPDRSFIGRVLLSAMGEAIFLPFVSFLETIKTISNQILLASTASNQIFNQVAPQYLISTSVHGC